MATYLASKEIAQAVTPLEFLANFSLFLIERSDVFQTKTAGLFPTWPVTAQLLFAGLILRQVTSLLCPCASLETCLEEFSTSPVPKNLYVFEPLSKTTPRHAVM